MKWPAKFNGAGIGLVLLVAFSGTTAAAGATRPTTRTITLPAEIKAYQEATLTAKVAGYLKSLSVDKGDRVKVGDLIADIEVPELLADRAQYEAQVEVAKLDFDRMQQAIKTAPDLITPQILDQARGKLKVAQAQLDRVNTLLRYARITAPFSGTITARYVDPGAYIPVPSNSDQKGAAVVSLMNFSEVRIQIPVPEDEALNIGTNTPATFTVQSLPKRQFRGAITRISYALDQGTKTMLAEIDMPNPGDVLRPGMYATVQFVLPMGAANARTP